MRNFNYKWLYYGPVLILIILVFGVYFKMLHADFVYDDYAFIVNNKEIRNFSPFLKFFTDPNIFTGTENDSGGRNWRPISSLFFAVEYGLFGAKPAGFHAVSILFHLLNIILVYLLVVRIVSRRNIALAVLSLWALHPALTEVISWVSNQSSLIFFGFFLLSALFLFKWAGVNRLSLWASYFFFTLALLSKETALGGVFLFFLFFLVYFKSQWKKFIPFVVIGLSYFLIRYQILETLGDHVLRGSFLKNLLLAPTVFFKYLSLSAWPTNLLLDYSNFRLPQSLFDVRVIFGALFFLIFIYLIWLGFKKSQVWLAAGAGWFIALLFPVMQIIPFQDIVGERFLYAPLAGLILVVVPGLEYLFGRIRSKYGVKLGQVGTAILIFIVVIFALLIFNRNNDWLNSENLWLSVIKVDGKNEKAFQNLSAFYLQKGDGAKTIEFSEKLLLVDPKNKAGRLHLAVGKILVGRPKEAEKELLELLRENPDYKPAFDNLSVLYNSIGESYTNSFIKSSLRAPAVEGNIVNSGIIGETILNNVPFEASFDVFESGDALKPVISIRTHDDGTFQIPLKPGFYTLKPLDPDGPIAPAKNSYQFVIGSGQWLQVRVEYQQAHDRQRPTN